MRLARVRFFLDRITDIHAHCRVLRAYHKADAYVIQWGYVQFLYEVK